MPLYEFRCPNGHEFEKFYRSIGSAQAEERCPECGVTAARLMSTAGLVFKGSGFYITDYGKDGKKAERAAAKTASEKTTPAAGETSASKPAESSSSASESKPASKPAAASATPAAAPASTAKKSE
jgi:putative FmdB family regulatory protein